MITVRFACGHQTAIAETAVTAPRCSCGETRIQRVAARAPTFRGTCTGPYAEYKALEPVPVDLTTEGKGRLRLTPQED